MKRISSWIRVALVSAMVIGSALTVEAGEKTAAQAQQELDAAVAAEQEAAKAYDAAKAAYETRKKDGYDKGAPGFYEWIVKTYSGGENQWMADDAQQALELYEKSEFRSYTKVGDETDASDLENMSNSLDLFPILIRLRANDEYFPDLPPVYTNSLIMARAQVNANASSYTMKHMVNDSGYTKANFSENLAFGYPVRNLTETHSAFNGWYYAEKQDYKKLYDYVSSHFPNGLRYNTEEFANYVYFPDTDGTKTPILDAWKEFQNSVGEIGHYTNAMSGITVNYIIGNGNIRTIKYVKSNCVPFGFGICTHGGLGDCTSLEANALTGGREKHLYTPEAYTNLFRQYYSTVNPQQEREQMNAAKARLDAAKEKVTSCQNALKRASRKTQTSQTQITVNNPPSSVKAKAKGRKVTVSWKKIKNNKNGKKLLKQIKSIQVQYSTDPTFQQNVVTKSVKKNKTKVTFKLKKKTQYYIRVRYVGKSGASNWSGVKRVKTK